MNPRTPGVGSALFPTTRAAAEELGLEFINATIRADNVSGLGYYAKMGFETYDRLVQVPLQDGAPVDRIKKRFRVDTGRHRIPDA
ncbi:ribosomal protein S18 acetylase RimI-like enzyme [Rhizobium leguminosarum]